MSDRFRVIHMPEAIKLGYIQAEECYDPDMVRGVFEFLPDNTVRLIGTDGGEPEDQSLWRDWAWVVQALNKAFEDGARSVAVVASAVVASPPETPL